VAYIGQTAFFTSGSSSTTAQVALTASVQDPDGNSGANVTNATVTFTDMLSGKVLASNVKVSPVLGSSVTTGTANTIVTLSTGQYGSSEYLIQVTLGGMYKNCQQTGPVSNASGAYCTGAPSVASDSSQYAAAHPTIAVMIPQTINTMQGGTTIPKLSTAAGTYGDATAGSYTLGMQYNNKGTNPQGQVQLVLRRGDGTYYVKSNSITSLSFGSTYPSKDATIYTKASIYRVTDSGALTSIDGNVTLRVDAHDGCAVGATCVPGENDTIGFTVLSSKNSSLYYSNNWQYDQSILGWRTIQEQISGPGGSAVRIN
jgi:hypothetical protein